MKQISMRLPAVILVLSIISGCTPGITPVATGQTVSSAGPTASPTGATVIQPPTSQPTPSVTLESPTSTPKPTREPDLTHRIGVRLVEGTGEFFDRQTGEKFIPRGFNYVRLAPMSDSNPQLWHSTLNPGFYDPEGAEADLQAMHAAGYNVVRIFIDCCRDHNNVGNTSRGISTTYLRNVIDFLEKAKAAEIYVLMILDATPADGGYTELWRECCENFDADNLRYLTPGGVLAKKRFDKDFIRALIRAGAPLDFIFAYDLTNEIHFSPLRAPFNKFSGTVTTANSQIYDMASEEDKQRMMDENLVYWLDQQRQAILEVDPSALVTGSFPAFITGSTMVNTHPVIWESTLDFIDLHVYLWWGLTLEDYVEQYKIDGYSEKPIILGEFGADKKSFATVEQAAQALQELQADSCAEGFDGWLMWTWNSLEQADLWHGTSENGEISFALAPNNRSDPCVATQK